MDERKPLQFYPPPQDPYQTREAKEMFWLGSSVGACTMLGVIERIAKLTDYQREQLLATERRLSRKQEPLVERLHEASHESSVVSAPRKPRRTYKLTLEGKKARHEGLKAYWAKRRGESA